MKIFVIFLGLAFLQCGHFLAHKKQEIIDKEKNDGLSKSSESQSTKQSSQTPFISEEEIMSMFKDEEEEVPEYKFETSQMMEEINEFSKVKILKADFNGIVDALSKKFVKTNFKMAKWNPKLAATVYLIVAELEDRARRKGEINYIVFSKGKIYFDAEEVFICNATAGGLIMILDFDSFAEYQKDIEENKKGIDGGLRWDIYQHLETKEALAKFKKNFNQQLEKIKNKK